MEKIYILKRKKIILGPYTMDRLINKDLKYTDMIWYEGLADWTPIHEIEKLKRYIKRNYSNRHLHVISRVFSFLK